MKQLKFILGLVIALGVIAPTMAAPTVTFDGNASVRIGTQYVKVDQNDDACMMFLADQRQDQKQKYFYGIMFLASSVKSTMVSYIGYASAATFLSDDVDATRNRMTNFVSVVVYSSVYTAYIAGGASAAVANAYAHGAATSVMTASAVSLIGLAQSLNSIATLWKKAGISSGELTKLLAGTSKSDAKSLWFGLKNNQSIRLNTNIKDDKITARVSVEHDVTNGLALKDAWVSYDFGALVLTYNTYKPQARFNADMLMVGDHAGAGSLDFKIKPVEGMGDVFVTLMSDHMQTNAKYEVLKNRALPITQLGYEISTDSFDLSAGGILDWYQGSDANISTTIDGVSVTKSADYVGYMGFLNATYKIGKMNELAPGSMQFGISLMYGQNTDKFAHTDADDTEGIIQACVTKTTQNNHRAIDKDGNLKDAQIRGGLAFAAVRLWEGALFFSRVSLSQTRSVGQNAYDDDDWIGYNWMTSYKVELALVQFFNKNFNVKLGAGYECYSIRPNGDAEIIAPFASTPKYGGWGMEGLLEAEYLF